MTDATTPEPRRAPKPAPSSQPSRTPAVLITIATILAVVAVFSVWLRTQALDTDAWVEVSSELLSTPEVQQSVSSHVVEIVFVDVDVAASLEERLPEALAPLAAPAAAAIRAPITDGVAQLLATDQFQSIWVSANRTAHQTLVAVIQGESLGPVDTGDGTVSLDLKPLVTEVASSLGLSGARIENLPDDSGVIVILDSDDLATVQDAVAALEFAAWLLMMIVVALYAAAVYLARGRRIAVLRHVGWSVLLVGVIVIALRGIAVRFIADSLVESESSSSLVPVVMGVATQLLGEMGWSAIIYGALIVLFTSLLGEHRWAVATRRSLAPLLNASTGAVVGGTVVVILLLLWWSPGNSFRSLTGSIILLGLIIGAVVMLRRQTLQEFPDAGSAEDGASATSADVADPIEAEAK